MNTATMIGDNTRATGSPQTGNRAKTALESTGDEPQQRFADVLPLAQAAMEKTSNEGATEKVPAKARSTKGKAVAESSGGADRPARRQGEAVIAEIPVTAWSFAGIVQPLVRPQAGSSSAVAQTVKTVTGQQTTEPTVSKRVHKSLEQTTTAQGAVDAGAVPVRAQPQTHKTQGVQRQASADDPSVTTRAVATTASKGAAPQGQETVSSASTTGGKQVAVAARQAPPEAGTAPVLSAAQAAPGGGTRAGRSDVRIEGAQTAAASNVAVAASQTNPKQDASAAVKVAVGVPSAVAQDKAGQTSTKAQAATSPQTAGSETAPKPGQNVPDSTSAGEVRSDHTAKPVAGVRISSPKGEPAQREAKDAAVSGVKDAGTAMADSRAVASGESVSTVQHVASSAQSQASVDAPAARTPAQSVGDQILDSVRSSGAPGEREILVRLRPPELGTVVVRFLEQGENLTGTLEVSTREAQREIEQALPQVLRGLQEAGVQVRRVEVVTSDQPDKNLGGEHLPQDAWQQQHPGAGQGREHSPASQAHWPQGIGERSGVRQGNSGRESQTAVAPGRIDVLL